MATNKAVTTHKATLAANKKAAPAPAASTAASTQAAKGTAAAKAAVPQATLYKVGKLPPVRPGTHRAYAQSIAQALAKANSKGFTLAAYRAALVAGAVNSSIAPPNGGWAKHNMPTWAAGQAWVVPVK